MHSSDRAPRGVLRRLITAVAGSVLLVASGCDAPAGTPLPTVAPARTPAPVAAPPADDVPEHIVVVVFENKGIGQIIGSGKAPAFDALARNEGILPALESSHAVAAGMQLARGKPKDHAIVVCLSGRGDKDAAEIARLKSSAP